MNHGNRAPNDDTLSLMKLDHSLNEYDEGKMCKMNAFKGLNPTLQKYPKGFEILQLVYNNTRTSPAFRSLPPIQQYSQEADPFDLLPSCTAMRG